MSGLLIFDYAHRYEEAVSRLADWVRSGRLRYREDILDGIDTCPGAIARLYRGDNRQATGPSATWLTAVECMRCSSEVFREAP